MASKTEHWCDTCGISRRKEDLARFGPYRKDVFVDVCSCCVRSIIVNALSSQKQPNGKYFRPFCPTCGGAGTIPGQDHSSGRDTGYEPPDEKCPDCESPS